jgi:hypothetical protein
LKTWRIFHYCSPIEHGAPVVAEPMGEELQHGQVAELRIFVQKLQLVLYNTDLKWIHVEFKTRSQLKLQKTAQRPTLQQYLLIGIIIGPP